MSYYLKESEVAVYCDSDRFQFNKKEKSTIASALSILSKRVFGVMPATCKDVREYLQLKIGTLSREVFGVLLLDAQQRIISDDIVFTGTLNSTSVHVRDLVKLVLVRNAASCIFYHNHPSGVVLQSKNDEALTNHLKNALALIDVIVLDHIIVSNISSFSFAENGLI